MDRKFVATGLGFGILGLLVGFVVSFVYGVCHKLWLGNNEFGLARIQFYLHVVGAIGITIGLYLLYGGIVAPENIEPVLSISSIAVLIGMILMKVLFVRSKN